MDARAVDVMSIPPITIGSDRSLPQAIELMKRSGVRHLVVTDRGRCAGVLDDRRLLSEWVFGCLSSTGRRVRDLVSAHGQFVCPDMLLDDVAQLLLTEPSGALPVLGADAEVIGVITASDIVAAVSTRAKALVVSRAPVGRTGGPTDRRRCPVSS